MAKGKFTSNMMNLVREPEQKTTSKETAKNAVPEAQSISQETTTEDVIKKDSTPEKTAQKPSDTSIPDDSKDGKSLGKEAIEHAHAKEIAQVREIPVKSPVQEAPVQTEPQISNKIKDLQLKGKKARGANTSIYFDIDILDALRTVAKDNNTTLSSAVNEILRSVLFD